MAEQKKQTLKYFSLELEEKIERIESEILRLRGLLSATIKERDETRLLLKSAQFLSQDEITDASISSNNISREVDFWELVQEDRLPEKGKFLEAVMKAGPLLYDIMLAGPLPKWKKPPPALNTMEIPIFSGSTPEEYLKQRQADKVFRRGRKRGLEDEDNDKAEAEEEECLKIAGLAEFYRQDLAVGCIGRPDLQSLFDHLISFGHFPGV